MLRKFNILGKTASGKKWEVSFLTKNHQRLHSIESILFVSSYFGHAFLLKNIDLLLLYMATIVANKESVRSTKKLKFINIEEPHKVDFK